VYGVVGYPVAHSLSPVVHNDVFAIVGRDAVYVPLDVAPGFEAFKALMIEIRDRPWLGIRGLSVTLPHKEFAYRYFVGEGAVLDPGARRIGAVNTIRFDADGRVTTANSDIDGAIAAIRAAYGDSVIGAGRGALILGAGGAARAMMAALLDLGFDVTVTNRTDERASKMAGEFGTSSVLWSDRMNASPQLIVNCTSVGMSPNDESSPWPKEAFDGVECVIDTVYRPVETLLLRDGIAAGCRVVDGLVMFATQASRQYEIWTGNGPDDGLYRRAVERAIKRGRLRGR
jgi:shikimate dehydrogenase